MQVSRYTPSVFPIRHHAADDVASVMTPIGRSVESRIGISPQLFWRISLAT